jgi:glycosyltransferase involved in cell wall biosynthesis
MTEARHPLASSSPGRKPQPKESGPIVIDGVFFQHLQDSGIARVWRSYLEEWLKSGFAHRVLFLDRGGAGPRLPGLPTRSIPPWDPDAMADDSLLLQRVCDEEGAALFVSTYYTTPIGTPSLMLVYDLIPERLRLDMSAPIWDEKRLAIEHASFYACISENTARDLLELKPVSQGKPAVVVPLGVGDAFRPASDGEIEYFRRAHRLDRPYFLLVGDRRGVDGYKNTKLLFRALRGWSGRGGHEVVCVGGRLHIEPELRLAAPTVRVRRLSLSDHELRLAYAGAIALVYPSRYEGFGLPVAEAMACGCPVITTKLASLPEVAGDAALYVDPDGPKSLREALGAVRDPDRRATMMALGIRRASTFRWDRAAAAFAAALSEAAAADTLEQRRARDVVWRARHEALTARQRDRSSRLLQAIPPLSRRKRAPLKRRLKSAALRYLPPRAVMRLRSRRRAFD